jgi:hypothetical protein
MRLAMCQSANVKDQVTERQASCAALKRHTTTHRIQFSTCTTEPGVLCTVSTLQQNNKRPSQPSAVSTIAGRDESLPRVSDSGTRRDSIAWPSKNLQFVSLVLSGHVALDQDGRSGNGSPTKAAWVNAFCLLATPNVCEFVSFHRIALGAAETFPGILLLLIRCGDWIQESSGSVPSRAVHGVSARRQTRQSWRAT